MKKLNILIADHYSIVSCGIAAVIQSKYPTATISIANTYESALDLINKNIDLFIVDMNMPVNNKLNNFELFLKKQSGLKILVYTAFNEKIYALSYLKSGAKGFLHKSEKIEKLNEAIEVIIQGKKYISPQVEEQLFADYLNDNLAVKPMESLSVRELQIAELLAQGYTALQISEKIKIQLATISITKQKIYAKLNVNNVLQLSEKLNFFSN